MLVRRIARSAGENALDNHSISAEEKEALVQSIATQLNEIYPRPIQCIQRIIEFCGPQFAQDVLKETFEVEEQGGLFIPNRKRRRTVGGVFFYLVRQKITPELEQKIFDPEEHPYWHPPSNSQILPDGEARLVEMTIKGRAKLIEERKEGVVVNLTHPMNILPNLPVGVPLPIKEPVVYKVYMSRKHWQNIQKFLHVPEDEIIIEGIWGRDPEADGMALFAMNVTTRQWEWLKRKDEGLTQPPQPPKAKQETHHKTNKEKKGEKNTKSSKAKPTPVPAKPTTANKTTQQLEQLRAAANLYRQKLAEIQAKPKDQQAALAMTQKLLQQTEAQIRQLEKQAKR